MDENQILLLGWMSPAMIAEVATALKSIGSTIERKGTVLTVTFPTCPAEAVDAGSTPRAETNTLQTLTDDEKEDSEKEESEKEDSEKEDDSGSETEFNESDLDEFDDESFYKPAVKERPTRSTRSTPCYDDDDFLDSQDFRFS
ncbi:unknown protein [Seminavis robusta]|uniref:Uncharacterized protein n=1 Tax=Seminavis robusta TaxID=568900 RepID=A0A9N8H7P8_9STRA|nr:unknown protein [Seminavis robusta]|eukprot:Sro188_g081250.1 n/a (143) ;mRNA; r:64993-65421